jgi:hypothetical protein
MSFRDAFIRPAVDSLRERGWASHAVLHSPKYPTVLVATMGSLWSIALAASVIW